jgi:hypothetical protein
MTLRELLAMATVIKEQQGLDTVLSGGDVRVGREL